MGGKNSGNGTKPTDLPERYGKDFLDAMDGRVRVVKAIREDLDALYAALGGRENVSYMEQVICLKIVYLKWMTGKTERTLIQGGSIDEASYLNAINCLSGLLSKIGLKRRAKPLTLKDYLNAKPEPPQPKEIGSTGREPITRKDMDNGNKSDHQRADPATGARAQERPHRHD